MKKMLFILSMLLVMSSISAFSQDVPGADDAQQHSDVIVDSPDVGINVSTVITDTATAITFVEFIKTNWVVLLFGLLGFIEIIVRLTPTKKDDSVFNFIKKLIDFLIPNFSKLDGTKLKGRHQ